jgi:hypothetical protein
MHCGTHLANNFRAEDHLPQGERRHPSERPSTKQQHTQFMKKTLFLAILGASAMSAEAITMVDGAYGSYSTMAQARFRNFQSGSSGGDFEWSIESGGNRATGNVPSNGKWQPNNEMWITYIPNTNPLLAGTLSLRMKNITPGASGSGATGPWDTTITRTVDLLPGPVNYIDIYMQERDLFPTIQAFDISDLDGTDFTSMYVGVPGLYATGAQQWSILDPGGATLNDGFVLHAFLDVDTSKLGGRETDKLNINIGYNAAVPGVPDGGTTLVLLGGALTGLGALRRKFRA